MVKEDTTDKKDPFWEREVEKYQTPVPSREYILVTLTELGPPVKRRALLKFFDLEDPDLREAMRRRLKAMIRDGQVLKTPQGYVPITEMETTAGTIVMEREGDGFLKTESGKNIYLSGPGLRGYYNGDKVEVQITQLDELGNTRGRIVKLIEAIVPLAIGRFVKNEEANVVIPFDRKFTQNILIPKKRQGEAKNGDIVQIKILRDDKYEFHTGPVGEVIEVLGDLSTPGIEVEMAIRKFNIPHEWPAKVLNEAEKLRLDATDKDREDLTKLNLVTIDGEDAKDFDDAVYCEKRTLGGWRLWVAIADVSHYVKPGMALDKEAIVRGNSTYFPGSVIPMLPEKLSNELCSLKPNVPRLCVVCEMKISGKGEVKSSKFYRAVIHSKARMTYTEVAEIIKGNKALIEQYGKISNSLKTLHDMFQALHAQRRKRGAIDFDTIETRILFDKSGKIKSIVPYERNVAHKMIEESMLAANVSAATFIQKHKRHSLFRVHDRPPNEKLTNLREFLAELGLDLPGGKEPQPGDFCRLVERIKAREDRHIIETVMLRSLSQAQYSHKNIGHFGLAYPSYTHFTSPIRRYPDLLVHREITDILASKKHKTNLAELEKLGLQCSETERRSDDATRDASLALKCHFMQDKVGEHYQGIVSGVASFGIFVELKDVYIEGLVHVTSLGNEYFTYDAPNHRMIGERSRKVYRLGDSLEVIVARVDVEAKKIDLELVNGEPRRERSHGGHSRPEKHKHKPKAENGQQRRKRRPGKKRDR